MGAKTATASRISEALLERVNEMDHALKAIDRYLAAGQVLCEVAVETEDLSTVRLWLRQTAVSVGVEVQLNLMPEPPALRYLVLRTDADEFAHWPFADVHAALARVDELICKEPIHP